MFIFVEVYRTVIPLVQWVLNILIIINQLRIAIEQSLSITRCILLYMSYNVGYLRVFTCIKISLCARMHMVTIYEFIIKKNN